MSALGTAEHEKPNALIRIGNDIAAARNAKTENSVSHQI